MSSVEFLSHFAAAGVTPDPRLFQLSWRVHQLTHVSDLTHVSELCAFRSSEWLDTPFFNAMCCATSTPRMEPLSRQAAAILSMKEQANNLTKRQIVCRMCRAHFK